MGVSKGMFRSVSGCSLFFLCIDVGVEPEENMKITNDFVVMSF